MDSYDKSKVTLHNAQKHLEALEKKQRKRMSRIEALVVETRQLESGLPAFIEKLEQAKHELKAAKSTYRILRAERKAKELR